MADQGARIRRFAKDDNKLIHFTVGKATMEPLAVANRKGTRHYALIYWTCYNDTVIVFSYHASLDHRGMDSSILYPHTMARLVATTRSTMVDLSQTITCVCFMVCPIDVSRRLVRAVTLFPFPFQTHYYP